MFSDLERQERPWADLRSMAASLFSSFDRRRRRDCVSAEWCAHAAARCYMDVDPRESLACGAALVKSKSLTGLNYGIGADSSDVARGSSGLGSGEKRRNRKGKRNAEAGTPGFPR
jgi:hypothetical protein